MVSAFRFTFTILYAYIFNWKIDYLLEQVKQLLMIEFILEFINNL